MMNTTRPDLKTLLTSILDYSSRSLKFPTDDSIGIFHFHNFVDFLVHQGALSNLPFKSLLFKYRVSQKILNSDLAKAKNPRSV